MNTKYMSVYTLATSAPILRNYVNVTVVFFLLFSDSKTIMLDAVVTAIIK
jgi:hypothetical protein